jgi:hypothetical protein
LSDDAVAPVIAVMLILAVGVTFFAAWNAYYVPSMKAQSEITHIRDVETGFLRFSSDIETAASLKKNLKLSELIPLGGGEFTFDPVRSGGELNVWNASPQGYLKVDWTSETGTAGQNLSLVRFSYKPVNNFWQDQGYGWAYGNVYVLNTERNLTTPLDAFTADNLTYGLAGTLIGLDPEPGTDYNCTSITVHMVNITPDRRHLRESGNGNGMLVLVSNVSTAYQFNATSLNISMNTGRDSFSRSLWNSTAWNATLWNSVNSSVDTVITRCRGNVVRSDPVEHEIRLTFNTVPNMTIIRETTEISVGAY